MNLIFAKTLGLVFRLINIEVQKIDGLLHRIYRMVSAGFSLQNRLGKVRFFEKNFLLGIINMKQILEILFLFLIKIDVKFGTKELT